VTGIHKHTFIAGIWVMMCVVWRWRNGVHVQYADMIGAAIIIGMYGNDCVCDVRIHHNDHDHISLVPRHEIYF